MIARFLAEGVGFEPTRERKPPGGFQDRCLKPLGHPSNRNDFSTLEGRPSRVALPLATACLSRVPLARPTSSRPPDLPRLPAFLGERGCRDRELSPPCCALGARWR